MTPNGEIKVPVKEGDRIKVEVTSHLVQPGMEGVEGGAIGVNGAKPVKKSFGSKLKDAFIGKSAVTGNPEEYTASTFPYLA